MRQGLPLAPTVGILLAAGLPVLAVTAQEPNRPRIAVVVLTLDDVRQGQAAYGRSLLEQVGELDRSPLRWVDAGLPPESFISCRNDRSDQRLASCIRYYLNRVERPADAPPIVVVAFDDQLNSARTRGDDEMRALCYGQGPAPADARAQSASLWPTAAKLKGVREWQSDMQALEACIRAAAETAPPAG